MRIFLIVIHIAFLLISCSRKSDSVDVFRYNQETAITSLDPAFANDQGNIWAVTQLYCGLVQFNEKLELQPSIAKRWESDSNGRVYRFYLRDDVYFHDHSIFPGGKGRRVVASDFSYSFLRIIDPKTASKGAWIFNDKVKGPDFSLDSDLIRLSEKTDVPFKAINDTVFEIHLSGTFPPFMQLLAMPYCYVVPHEAVTAYGRDFRENPVGTGPFRFKYWEESVRLVFEKNPDYFETDNLGQTLPYLDGVMVSFIENKQTAFMEFVQGKLDFFNGLDGSFKDELLTRSGKLKQKYQGQFKLSIGPYLNTEYFGFNLKPEIHGSKSNLLKSRDLRIAISYAIDRRKMIRYLRNGVGYSETGGFIPRGLPGYDSAFVAFAYNPALAREHLSRAGYPNGKNFPGIVLNTNTTYVDLAVFIQNQLAEVGIQSTIEVRKGPFHRDLVKKSELPFFRGSWLADYPDAENYLALFYSKNVAPSGPNTFHYTNPEFDRLYERSLSMEDPIERGRLYTKMDKMVMEDAPIVVLFYDQTLHLLQNNVQGFEENAMNVPILKKVSKE